MILFIDTETTGLTTASRDWMAQPGICQIGAIKVAEPGDLIPGQNGEVIAYFEIDSFYTLVNPEISQWQPDAIKTHGITPEKVQDAPTFFEIGPALARFTLGCRAWAGFHTKFDKDVLWWQLQKYGFERSYPWPLDEIDVMRVAGRVMETQGKRGMKNPSLEEAYQHFIGSAFEGAHDAIADIRATFAVWKKIVEGANNAEITDALQSG